MRDDTTNGVERQGFAHRVGQLVGLRGVGMDVFAEALCLSRCGGGEVELFLDDLHEFVGFNRFPEMGALKRDLSQRFRRDIAGQDNHRN